MGHRNGLSPGWLLTLFDTFPVLTGAVTEVTDDEAVEGVDMGEEGEDVAKATEHEPADLIGKIIPVKGKRIGLAGECSCSRVLSAGAAGLKGAEAAAAKVAW